MRTIAAIVAVLGLLGACTDDEPEAARLIPGDGGIVLIDAAVIDARDGAIGLLDAALAIDARPDAAVLDASVADARPDAAVLDAAIADARPDAAVTDARPDALTDAAIDAPMGCPANPTCVDTSPSRVTATNPTGLCRGICDAQCQHQYWRWSFWVTQYNVGQTLGFGEHQGLAIIGYSYKYDDRYAWNAPGATAPPWRNAGALWAQGMAVPAAKQFDMRTLNPSGETIAAIPISQATQPASLYAYCSHTRLMDTPLYNHGRALGRTVPTDAPYAGQNLIPMRPLRVTDQCLRADGGWCRSATLQHPAQIGACMATITDGACDSRCGNCSYVAYTNAVSDGSAFYYEDVNVPAPRAGLTVRGARNEPTARVEYVGGVTAGAVDNPMVATYAWSVVHGWYQSSLARVQAPFTHCYDTTTRFTVGTDNTREWVVDATPDSLTGRWGHNSNTDAALELDLFGGCGTTPTVTNSGAGLHAACTRCGTPVLVGGATTQYPCRAPTLTSTAELWWGETQAIHNVDDLSLGLWPGFTGNANTAGNPSWLAANRPMPTCAWGGFKVWGM